MDILSDTSKFKKLRPDPTITVIFPLDIGVN